MRDLQFQFPLLGYLASGILIVVLLFLSLFWYRKKKLGYFSDSSQLVLMRSQILWWIKLGAYALTWLFSVLALMQPIGNIRFTEPSQPAAAFLTGEKSVVLRRKAHEVMFLVDASASMAVNDARSGKSRLAFAKEIVADVLSQLTGETVSLYTFTSEVTDLVPPTLDYIFFQLMLEQIKINEGDVSGTNFLTTLTKMNQKVNSEPLQKLKTLIIFSDGGDIESEILKSSERTKRINEIISVFKNAQDINLRIVTVGMGSLEGGEIPGLIYQDKPVHVSLEPDILKLLAEKGRGKYFIANDDTPYLLAKKILKVLAQDSAYIDTSAVTKKQRVHLEEKENLVYDDYFQYPLALAILMLLLIFLLPDTSLKKAPLLFCLFFALPLNANDTLLLEQKAETFYEAQDYDQARETYERMLLLDLAPWEKAILTYNLGNVFLAQNEGNEAISLFYSIPYGSDPFPLLLRRLNTNLALALLRKGQVKEALTAINSAKEADCDLMLAIGAKECAQAADLVAIEKLIKQERARISEKESQLLLENRSFEEDLSLLINRLTNILEKFSLLQNERIAASFRDAYAHFLQNGILSLSPIWEKMRGIIPEMISSELFEKAHEAFKNALTMMEQKNNENAKGFLEFSLNDLKQIRTSMGGTDVIRETLQKLLDDYRLISVQELLQEISLNDLLEEQESLKEEPLPQILKGSTEFLKSSIKAVQENDQKNARIFFEEAFYLIKRHLVESGNESGPPINVLKLALDDQKQALLLAQIAKGSDQSKTIALLREAQNRAKNTGDKFFNSVIPFQREMFMKHHCLKDPWSEALPFFTSGYESAKTASQMLALNPVPLANAIPAQESAVSYWESALKALEQWKSEEESKTQTKPEERSFAEKLETLFRDLQEMELQDQEKETQGPIKQGRKTVVKTNVIFLFFLCAFPFYIYAQAPVVTAEIDQNAGIENKILQGTITITHSSKETIDETSFRYEQKPLKVEKIKDLPINAETLITLYRFELEAKPKGLYVLSPVSITVGGKQVASFPSTFQVKAEETMEEDKNVVLKLEPFLEAPTPLYPGQRARLGYRIYYRGHIELTEEKLPLFDSQDFIKIGDKQFKDYEKGGLSIQEIYQEVEANKPGTFTYAPSLIEGHAYEETPGRRKVYQKEKLRAQTDQVTLVVVPFPGQEVPASFDGAVGEFTLNVSVVPPSKVQVGDNLQLKILISGKGNLPNVVLPILYCQPGFSGFFHFDQLPSAGTLEGATKSFLVQMRPISPFIKEIPPIEFSYFDPIKKQYVTLHSNPIPVEIMPLKTDALDDVLSDVNASGPWHEEIAKLYKPFILKSIPLSLREIRNNIFRSSWVLLLIPLGITFIIAQLFLRHFLLKRKEQMLQERSVDLFEIAVNKHQKNLLIRAFLLRLYERGRVATQISDWHNLQKEGIAGQIRSYFEKIEEDLFSGKKDYSQEGIFKNAKELFEKI